MRAIAGLGAALLAAALAGLLLPAAKLLAGRVEPVLLAGGVWLVGGLLLTFTGGRWQGLAGEVGALSVRGLVALILSGFAAPLLALRGLGVTHSSTAGVIVVGVAAAVAVLPDALRSRAARPLLGVALALLGTISAAAPFWPHDLRGPLLLAGSGALWGLAAWLAPGAGASRAAGPVWALGGGGAIALGLAQGAWWPMGFDLGGVAILGGVGLAAALLLARLAGRWTGSSRTGVVLMLLPVVGLAVASGPLGEPFPCSVQIGTTLLLLGLLLHPQMRRPSPPWAP